MFLLKGLYGCNTLCIVVVVVVVAGRICDILYRSKPFGFQFFYDLNCRREYRLEHYYYLFVEKHLHEKLDLYVPNIMFY